MPLLISVVAAWIAGLLIAAFAAAAAKPEWSSVFSAACGSLFALVLFGAASTAATQRHAGTSRVPRRRTGDWYFRFGAILVSAFTATTIGGAHWRDRANCLHAMDRAARDAQSHGAQLPFDITIDEAVRAGAFTRGVANGTGSLSACSLPVNIRVRDGLASGGDVVRVTGTALATDKGFRIDGSVQRSATQRSLMRAMRARAGVTIDTLFGPRAPLVRALLIADQDGVDPQLRDTYAQAGLVHLLSISGLHVSIIAEALLIIATALRLSRTAASAATLALVALYVTFLGAPPSAVRSGVMMATLMISQRLQRPVHSWTALALGAAIPTFDPAVVIHLGWQLSVGGMASLVAAREVLRRITHYEARTDIPRLCNIVLLRARRLRGWRKLLMRELITGSIATSVTAPLIAWNFGRVSVVAPFANIAAGPVVAVLQPALFLALLIAPLRFAAKAVADACVIPLMALDAIASSAAHVPFASLRISPGLFGAACAGLASALFVRATASRRLTPGVVAAAFLLVLGLWAPLVAGGSGRLELHMIDVGQGDALALRTPHGKWILMDAGPSFKGGDAGRRVVVPYLQRIGGPVALFVLSHAHDDHVGGAPSVIESLHPAKWLEPAFITTTPMYRRALVALQRGSIPWKRVYPDDSMIIDGVHLRILGPDSVWTARQTNPNEASVVVLVEYRGVRFLLTGDAEGEEEAWLLRRWPGQLHAQVLKLGHHGSRTSSSASFIDAVQPVIGLASVGAANRYHHPSTETLESFLARKIPVLRTDREGSIVVSTDGAELQVSTGRERWTLPLH